MAEHRVTSKDLPVYRYGKSYPGTVAQCICGWSSSWAVRDGSAEADANQHMVENQPGFAEAQGERQRLWLEKEDALRIERRKVFDAAMAAREEILPAIEDARAEVLETGKFPKPRKPVELCHECTCFLNPPCSNCENCLHLGGEIDCDNDCRTCEEPHEY